MGRGIDYGMGLTNIDVETGIRYGVIPVVDIGQAWYDSSEPDYGEPTCPECGNPATELSDGWPEEYFGDGDFENEGDDYVCLDCRRSFYADGAFELMIPLSWSVYDGEYTAVQGGDDTDVFIIKSPYYTRAEFCSPCAPGACYLRNFYSDGEKAYCFGHDWFEDGIAPYPVYRVEDDSEVFPA